MFVGHVKQTSQLSLSLPVYAVWHYSFYYFNRIHAVNGLIPDKFQRFQFTAIVSLLLQIFHVIHQVLKRGTQ